MLVPGDGQSVHVRRWPLRPPFGDDAVADLRARAEADIRGTLVAVHFRDERGFAIFSIEQDAGSRVRALGYLPPDVALRAVVRAGGAWTQHARYRWRLQVRSLELIDHLDLRGIVAFLVAYTTHLGPVRAADAVARFGSRIFEVIREHPQDLCVIKGITPERACAVRRSRRARCGDRQREDSVSSTDERWWIARLTPSPILSLAPV